MSISYVAGFFVGFFCVLFIFGIIIFVLKKKAHIGGKCEYDERQQLVRGKAFKIGFFTLIFYNAGYGLLSEMIGRSFASVSFAMLFGIIFTVVIYGAYCMWNDAYFALNETPKTAVALLIAICMINLIIGITNLVSGRCFVNGMITVSAMNLIVGVALFILFIIISIKTLINKNAERED
ncbi:MAG: hypothetical protein GX567_13700 [Clostridia bacterium]|nr:hypothetical protein [Clostridia bacterium]